MSVLLALIAACSIVLASAPDRAVRDAAQGAGDEAADTEASGLARSPEPRHAGPATPRETAARAVAAEALTRPADPLVRLVHAHVAQYGGDLLTLTALETP